MAKEERRPGRHLAGRPMSEAQRAAQRARAIAQWVTYRERMEAASRQGGATRAAANAERRGIEIEMRRDHVPMTVAERQRRTRWDPNMVRPWMTDLRRWQIAFLMAAAAYLTEVSGRRVKMASLIREAIDEWYERFLKQVGKEEWRAWVEAFEVREREEDEKKEPP